MGKREPQTILKTDERSIHLELGRERKFNRRLQRRCNGGDTITETALYVVTPLPWPIELGEHVGE
jgi:hypothetical protein